MFFSCISFIPRDAIKVGSCWMRLFYCLVGATSIAYHIIACTLAYIGTGSTKRKLGRFLKSGVLMDIGKLEEFCRTNLGNLTFMEAHHKTGRMINITIGPSRLRSGAPPLLNFLTAPNVLLWSAACASCEQPGLYDAVDIWAKDVNGSLVPMWCCSDTTSSSGSRRSVLAILTVKVTNMSV